MQIEQVYKLQKKKMKISSTSGLYTIKVVICKEKITKIWNLPFR